MELLNFTQTFSINRTQAVSNKSGEQTLRNLQKYLYGKLDIYDILLDYDYY